MGNKSSKDEKALNVAVHSGNIGEVARLIAKGVSSTSYKDDVSKTLTFIFVLYLL